MDSYELSDTAHAGHEARSNVPGRSFRYKPLRSPREIRVLRVTVSSSLELSIEHRNLDHAPLYTAVSYTWGPEYPKRTLTVDGLKLVVRKGVASMIRGLSDKRNSRYLWIDAVCIDQDSNQEKNHQVRLMGEIYSRANYVVAYFSGKPRRLGPRTGGASTYSKLVKLVQMAGFLPRAPVDDLNSTQQITAEQIIAQQVLGDRYFTRRWTIQEFCLARVVVVQAKGHELTFDQLQALIAQNEQSAFSRIASSLCRLRSQIADNTSTLEDLLYDHETAECSNFQDKIYALLSLAPTARLYLPVDYNLQRLELLMSVLDVCLSREGMSPYRIVSFVLFLCQQLGVSWDHLCHGISQPVFSTLPENATFHPRIVFRGTVLDRFDGQEQTTARLRPHLPSMMTYSPIVLHRQSPTGFQGYSDHASTRPVHLDHVKFSQNSRHQEQDSISPNDQWIFAASLEPGGSSSRNTRSCVGLSTVVTQAHDEVWQFCRTPLALILRPTVSGYGMIGRAQLLRPNQLQPERELDLRRLETVLDWMEEDHNATDEHMIVTVTPQQLLQMLCWIDVDQSSRLR